jgi:hypothetical protein
MRSSLFAEFSSPEAILHAAERLRELGYTRLDAITPFHFPELEEAIGVKRSRLPVGVFIGGITGTTLAFLIMWYTNAVNYALNVGGRPLNSFVSDIPIMFETTVLLGGATSFVLALILNGLPRLYSPITEVKGIERTTIDRYWLEIDRSDPVYNPNVLDELSHVGAIEFHSVEAMS